jgi:RNA polymerase sigma-70 factor, ECF subfamily
MGEDKRVVAEQVIVNPAISVSQKREDEALGLAVRQHARLVYRIAYSVLRNHHDAEDATQETFLRVLRYRRELAGVRDPRTWLARIAWRVAVERRRKADVPLEDTSEVLQTNSALPADQMILRAELSAMLNRLIEALPAKLRDPLALSTLEELTPANIAAILGIREAAVRSRLFRARQVLREKLEVLLDGKHGT